jgi:DnaJ-domain-containing protein 1
MYFLAISVKSAVPTRGLAWSRAWEELERAREELLRVIRSSDARVWLDVRAPHSVFGVLSGVDWLRIVGAHEERHAAQIREAGRAALDPGSTRS